MRMRNIGLIAALALGSAVTPVLAEPLSFGIVGMGGASIPIEQEDNDATSARFGVRFPASTSTIFSLEPYFFAGSGGTTELDIGGITTERDGIDLKSAGINVALGRLTGEGFRFYPFGGVGSTVMTREGLDQSKLTWNFGLGMGAGPGGWLIDLRGEMNMVDTGDASRKWVGVTLGLGRRITPGW
ncbi:MAG: hypothetical protein ACREOU_02625 [Candidatus Eiseniibacteriota bacterium]